MDPNRLDLETLFRNPNPEVNKVIKENNVNSGRSYAKIGTFISVALMAIGFAGAVAEGNRRHSNYHKIDDAMTFFVFGFGGLVCSAAYYVLFERGVASEKKEVITPINKKGKDDFLEELFAGISQTVKNKEEKNNLSVIEPKPENYQNALALMEQNQDSQTQPNNSLFSGYLQNKDKFKNGRYVDEKSESVNGGLNIKREVLDVNGRDYRYSRNEYISNIPTDPTTAVVMNPQTTPQITDVTDEV
jgi:hypothetical protein